MRQATDAKNFVGIWAGTETCYELARFDELNLLVMLGPRPVRRGHSLVVPRPRIEHWHDLPPLLAARAMVLGQITAKYLISVLTPNPARVELHVMGYRVPHTHLKIIPSFAKSDNRAVFEFTEPRPAVSAAELIGAQRDLAFPPELTEATAQGIIALDTHNSFELIETIAADRAI